MDQCTNASGSCDSEECKGQDSRHPSSDVTARPESRRPAQAEPCGAKPYEAPAGLPVAHGWGFTFLKPQAVAQAVAWVAECYHSSASAPFDDQTS